MKLYIKEKVFSWNERFTVKDENGWDKYYAEGELFSLGKKLRLLNIHGEEVALIQQQLFTLMPRYSVSVAGRQIAEIRKEFTFFFQRYVIDGLGGRSKAASGSIDMKSERMDGLLWGWRRSGSPGATAIV